MSDYMHKEYKLPNGRTVTADFNELGCAMVTIQAMDALFDIINSSDFVEVVRCKNCKHYVIHTLFGHSQGWCERLCDEFDKSLAHGAEEYDYCSYGKRAEE